MVSKSCNGSAKPTALSPSGGTAVFAGAPKRAVVFVDGSNWYHIRLLWRGWMAFSRVLGLIMSAVILTILWIVDM